MGRYCRNCGHELRSNDRFCTGCGSPVQQTAQLPTPEANVPVPPPSHQQQSESYPQQASSSDRGAGRVRTSYYWIAFVVLTILVLMAGDNGTAAGFIGVVISTVWVYRDAKSRGMDSAMLWALGIFLLWIVFFPLYFFKRKSHHF